MSLKAVAPGDRNVSWLDQCHHDWCFKPIKYLCTVNSRVLSEDTPPDTEIEYIDIGSVNSDGTWNASEPMIFREAPSRARRIVSDGDVLISTVRTYLRAIAHIKKANGFLICSTGFAVLSAGKTIDPRFMAYWVQSKFFVDEIVSRSVGVSYPAINASDIGNLPLPELSSSEQCTIASFLDKKTSSIDDLITKKQRQIELLQEKRVALISHMVTKGLDPNVAMKDPGVEWLGKIPEHWEVWKTTHGFGAIGSGTTPKSDDLNYHDGDISWVTTSELRENTIKNTKNKLTESALEAYSSLKIYPSGTLLIAMYGATIGRLGILAIPATVNQACCAFSKPKQFDTKFFFYWLIYRRPILISLSTGGGQPNLSQEDLRSLRVPLPPLDEQLSIVAFLDKELGEIQSLIEKIAESIDLLLEYRAALISFTVTGKIDVRQGAA
jgi:type I restriction enzyme, S subunit